MTNDRAPTSQQQLELFDLGKIDESQVPESHPVVAREPEPVFVRPELPSGGPQTVAEPPPSFGRTPSWEELLERTGRLLASKRPELAHPHAQDLVRLRPSDLEAQLMAATAAVLAKEHAIADAHLASASLLLTRRTPEIFREQWRALSELLATRRERARAQDKRGRRERRTAELRAVKKRLEPDRVIRVEPAETPAMAPDLELGTDPALPSLEPGHGGNALGDYVLRRAALAVMSLKSYETLLAFAHVEGVDRYEYQVRTVTRVLAGPAASGAVSERQHDLPF